MSEAQAVDQAVVRAFETTIKAIGSLPVSTDALAEQLKQAGFKGRTGHLSECVLAKWLGHQFAENNVDAGAYVAPGEVEVQGNDYSFQFSLPPHVTRFVTYFDEGKYPDLIENGTEPPF